MILIGLILFPAVMAAAAFAIPWPRVRVWLLPLTGLVHLTLTVVTWWQPDLGRPGAGTNMATGGEWLALDALGRIVLLLVSTIFFLCAIYAVGYLRDRRARPNRVFCGCLLMMLAMMTLVIWSQHLGLMWVAIEATTLSAAPLIYFNHTARSIEATWKYLLVGSVGIALALLGSFFLAYASLHGPRSDVSSQVSGTEIPSTASLLTSDTALSRPPAHTSLILADLIEQAPNLSKPWLHVAFVFLLVGYGTKMGLAPMHTWKPDAYGEAPGMVGALLAGGVTSCAFLAILRVYQICIAAGEVAYASRMLVLMGLVSMAVAGVFMVGQRDFKRMLAYSSVEHMGILILGIGIGGGATFGALLHLINNGLAKGVMFLSAGNIHRAYDSKLTDDVRGAMHRLPISGALFLAGFLAVTGSPPFAPFLSEFAILNGALAEGRYAVSALYLLFLLVVFIGMGATVLMVVQGRPPEISSQPLEAGGAAATSALGLPTSDVYRDGFFTVAPALIFMGLVLILGLYLPEPLQATLREAAVSLGARP